MSKKVKKDKDISVGVAELKALFQMLPGFQFVADAVVKDLSLIHI